MAFKALTVKTLWGQMVMAISLQTNIFSVNFLLLTTCTEGIHHKLHTVGTKGITLERRLVCLVLYFLSKSRKIKCAKPIEGITVLSILLLQMSFLNIMTRFAGRPHK